MEGRSYWVKELPDLIKASREMHYASILFSHVWDFVKLVITT